MSELVKPHPQPLLEFGEGRVISDFFVQLLPLNQNCERHNAG